jgi:FlaA1/EpsC-like NDP-sugar epimerase
VRFNWRTLVAFAHDLSACAVAWLAAFWLRFNLEVPEQYADLALRSLAWVALGQGLIFVGFGLYRGIWRFASLPDLRRIIIAATVGALAVPAMLFMLQLGVPRAVLIMNPIFVIVMTGGSRLAYRIWKERRLGSLLSEARRPVLVLGGDEAGVHLVRELARSSEWRAVGILDDEIAKHGGQLHGVTVLGGLADIALWSQKLGVHDSILALPQAPHSVRRRAIALARDAGLNVLTVPAFDDLMSGRVSISQVRKVEVDDLLGRDPVVLDTVGLRSWIHDRVVMVTGAGGSIGSELVRQLAHFVPRLVILLEHNEFALYTIEQELAERFPGLAVVCAIGDVKDASRVAQLMTAHRPSVVFHAAAYKHVPLMENDNAWQAVLNNAGGTRVLAQAAIAHGVEKFVLISTDKAVNPTNVMGASKRLAEMVCQASQAPATATRFVIVRFGNVLGSAGSVIPKFREQIVKGGPVTVTHPEITRYFMSIPEAVQLVLQAGLMGQGGEIFVLDMGEPVRIADLARDMIRLSGFNEGDIKIAFTGLRPGEKLYEEPLGPDEDTLPTPHPKLRIAKARTADGPWAAELAHWLATDAPSTDEAVRTGLARWIPEYSARP